MVWLWCGKFKLSKPYLGFVKQSRSRLFSSLGALFHHQTITNNDSSTKILGQYITVSSIVGQISTLRATLRAFDSSCSRGVSRVAVEVSLSDISCGNALVKTFSLSGSVNDALKVFDEMPEKNFESWFVMMKCFVENGYGQEAMDFFIRFKQEGNKPDGEIFKEVLSACTLTGDVDEGLLQFEAMQREYGIVPSMEHYHGFVKMLATSGYLKEALNVVERMPMEPSVDIWETLMNLSRVHGDLELGDRCAELVEKLDPTRLDKMSSAGFVTKASDFVKEEPRVQRYECIRVFRANDTSHPDTDKIYETLKFLKSQMLEMGYVLGGAEKMHKGERVFGYSEELAVISALLNSGARSTIRVINDIRICPDCHYSLKWMSVVTGREVIKRDSKRFHRFKNGACSCNDYW